MPRNGGKKKWKSTNFNKHGYGCDRSKQPPPCTGAAKPTPGYDQKIQAEAQALFEKKFAFKRPTEGSDWALPPAESLFSSTVLKDWDSTLNRYKEELNDLKCQLSDKDIQQWHQHTTFTHRSALVMPHLRSDFWVELCTQAWCKFYEIVSSYDVIPLDLTGREGACFNSVHLCEAPGAFVTSLNHYLKSNAGLKHAMWNWLATTLNPYYEGNSTDAMIADDRFILQTQDHWFFGEDNTGDVMNVDNLKSLQQRVNNSMGKVQLVTADGSINCQNDPAEQEMVVSQLHYCEIATAATLLADGGSFILKMFTLFEHPTACLMYFLNCAFREVHVCKPATSKAGNSEVYVVCLRFVGQQNLEQYLQSLLGHFGPADCPQALFSPSDIPDSFLDQLRSCAATFKTYQMDAISENIWLYPQMSNKERHRLTQVRQACQQAYVERYAVKNIKKADKICPDAFKGRNFRARGMFTKTASKRLHGTFMERQQLDHGHWLQRLNADYQQLAVSTSGSEVISQTLQSNRELMPSEVGDWGVVIGRRLTSIQSSSFCVAEVLDDWNLAYTHSEVGSDWKEEDLGKSTNCDEAIVGLMLADLTNLCRIVRTNSAVNCLCLLTRSQETFLQLLNTSEHWSLKECQVAVTDAGVDVTVVETGQMTDPVQGESESSTASTLGIPHLRDWTVVSQCSVTLQTHKVPVVFSDCFLGVEGSISDRKLVPEELDTRLQSLTSVLLAMNALQIGGTLILFVPGILTRFSAGLLYIIHKTFQQVTLMADIVDRASSRVAIVGRGFVGAHPALTKHLFTVYSSVLENCSDGQTEVLTFVPQSQLCEKEFNSAVTEFSQRLLRAQTGLLVQAELIAQQGGEQMESNTPEQTR
ncbi:cap-specific mRNA (nucleoside-2'-O-)-methyltransferase 2-like [Acanthaster planci]|uniref:Cap-specific mRNA (nucleoside-2'-O-)-methyltransferase 2 n=1 Tax=Acanthaster planci TaxID=133434 RepID=A0A8B7YTF3_ACAPL|nr:cap-specific mRNA (nucleoside-2'-O-)-methyltransferase 2-like [Acanthaster planci]